MPRALLTTSIVAAEGGGLVVVENALVRIYERGTTTPATGVFADEVGGSAITSVLSDVHGIVTLWFDTSRVVDLNITDNSHTATRVGTSTPAIFGAYTLPAIPDGGGGGGGGGVATVDGDAGPDVVLTDTYLSFLAGAPQPTVPATVGSGTFTPDLSDGWRHKVLTNGGPTTIAQPTVPAGTTYRCWYLMLKNDGTGGYGDPAFPGVTFIGLKTTRQQGPNKFDEYLFETDDGGTTWLGRHLSASFGFGANSVNIKQMAASSVATPAAGELELFMDSADGVLKVKDEHNQLHVCLIHAGTTAPTNTAIPWFDTNP